jgi:two-component system, NtrC family, sensor kinase
MSMDESHQQAPFPPLPSAQSGSGLRPASTSRLALKVTVLLACLLSLVLLTFTFLVIHIWTRSCVDLATSETERLTDTLNRSCRYSMLHAQRESMHATINAIGKQKDIEWVRIFNKEGKISYSTAPEEVDTVLDKKAEACYLCHQAEAPLVKLSGTDRTRIFTSKNGNRVLATIEPIYNEPSCSTAECHAHPASQSVLGVLDVALSLEPTDRVIRERAVQFAIFGFAAIAAVCLLVAFSLHRFVGTPVRRLVAGTQKIASGQFNYLIPVSGNDEIAELARSFNEMTASLDKAYTELRALTNTLEQRVEQKTQELKSAQMQIVRAEKLASLGRMAAGVAHELNSPLTGVLTFAHLVAKKVPKDSQEAADLQVIITETNRCARIIKDLLQFARETQVDRREEDLNNIVRHTMSILQPQAQFHNVNVHLSLDENLPKVIVDAAQIKQVLMNIVLNAVEAMGQTGDLDIRTGREERRAVLTIKDTGCGISQENLGRIFDPFFTTKDPGKGTGLGLAVSLKLIENHGGTIEVTSEVGKGATFRVVLPIQGPGKE